MYLVTEHGNLTQKRTVNATCRMWQRQKERPLYFEYGLPLSVFVLPRRMVPYIYTPRRFALNQKLSNILEGRDAYEFPKNYGYVFNLKILV